MLLSDYKYTKIERMRECTMRVSTFGGYCHDIELATREGRKLAVEGLPGDNNNQPKDFMENFGHEDTGLDPGVMKMYGWTSGIAVGGISGAVGGAALGARFGQPAVGAVLGAIGGGAGLGALLSKLYSNLA